ncbi:hypothetical protein C4J88_2731 [Pseudomonas sp. R4-39-08]|nr:hypothetical protein C4J88_2731 [Pseudomonas sp. R4-39-08]
MHLNIALSRILELGKALPEQGLMPGHCRSELAREKRPGDAFILDNRGGPEFFASKLAPTKSLD